MRATYESTASYYTRNDKGQLVKHVYASKRGHNAKAAAKHCMEQIMLLMEGNADVVCVECYTCLGAGEVRGCSQPMERSSYRYRGASHWTHTDL